jgi:hypothetical protein
VRTAGPEMTGEQHRYGTVLEHLAEGIVYE